MRPMLIGFGALMKRFVPHSFLSYALAVLLFPALAASEPCPPPRSASERPVPILLPLASPDKARIAAGETVTIDVLANDVGVPPVSDPAPEMKLDTHDLACGSASLDGRKVVYRSDQACAGQAVQFSYSVKLRNMTTCQDDWVSASVTVSVGELGSAQETPRPQETPASSEQGQSSQASTPASSQPPLNCDLPRSRWSMMAVDAGRFAVNDAPREMADLAKLADTPVFSVEAFCMTRQNIAAQDLRQFLDEVTEEEMRTRYPELLSQKPSADTDGSATGVSKRVADALAKKQSDANAKPLNLPTVNELIAAGWQLMAKSPDGPETIAFFDKLRSLRQWTRTPCGGRSDTFYIVGPETIGLGSNGGMTKLCFDIARQQKTGFRLTTR